MCVIYFAYKVHPHYPLILLANRDEFYARPTATASFWQDHPNIFAGRDLVAGGTWLGITVGGRVAAVTNYREPGAPHGDLSRGDLVAAFLKSDEPAEAYLAGVESRKSRYSGFNLLVGEFNADRCSMFYSSNRTAGIRELRAGVYGLSNHLLDTPWPKVRNGTERFTKLLSLPSLEKEPLFNLLADESLADEVDLPDTGVGYVREKSLSAIFIQTPGYGTRCSNLVTFDRSFEGKLEERVFI